MDLLQSISLWDNLTNMYAHTYPTQHLHTSLQPLSVFRFLQHWQKIMTDGSSNA